MPFSDIDALSNDIETNRLSFPCKFHLVYVDQTSSEVKPNVENLGFMVSSYMSMFDANCLPGTCGDNYTVSVSLDSGKGGALSVGEFDGNNEVVDEYLGSVFGKSWLFSARSRGYTIAFPLTHSLSPLTESYHERSQSQI